MSRVERRPRLSSIVCRLQPDRSTADRVQALLLDPAVLCVDELSLGLAPVVVGELLEIVQRLNEAGVTLIVVEQSLNIAAQMCVRAVFLEKGQVRFEGRTGELLENDDIARAVFLGGAATSNGQSRRRARSQKR